VAEIKACLECGIPLLEMDLLLSLRFVVQHGIADWLFFQERARHQFVLGGMIMEDRLARGHPLHFLGLQLLV